MSTVHYIWMRRLLTGVVFSMVLVLTPRAWVDEGAEETPDTVPVQTLEPPSDCLWCEPAGNANCSDDESADEPRMWLHPDEPIPATQRPCTEDEQDSKPSA